MPGVDGLDTSPGPVQTPPEADELLADEEDAESDSMSFGDHVLAFFKELFVVVIGAVIVASLLRGFVGQMFLIPSVSMANTLLVSDRVVVEKLSSVKRGQVVVFGDPGGWLTGAPVNQRGSVGKALEFIGVLPDTGTEHLIKRVVGMPGDHVVCCDAKGRITVNGQPLDETSYLFKGSDGTQVKPSEIRFDVIVPAHRIFVMGDHRDDSRDSRCHLKDVTAGAAKGDNAFVPEDQVVGQAIVVVWPINRAKRLAIPATYESVPSGKTPAPSQPTIVAGPEANC